MSEPAFQEMLERYRRQQLEVEQALEGFQCPDPSGVKAPCATVDQRDLDHPHIRVGSCFTECPVFAKTECAPYRRLLEIKEARAHAQWTSDGEEAGIPLRLMDASFKRGAATPALEAAKTYFAAGRRGRALVLLGPSGTGKSFAAVAVVRAWSGSHSRPGLFATCDALVNQLLDWDQHADVITRTKRAALLVLDDLGRGYMKRGGLAIESIEEILAYRHDELLPTVITTNWTLPELRKNLNARIIDRLRDWAEIIALTGPSLRRG